MTLNKLFLGDNSVVDITTEQTVDEIKLKLATRYQVTRLNPKSYFSEEYDDFSSVYVYHVKKEFLKIFFTKDLNRKVRHLPCVTSFQSFMHALIIWLIHSIAYFLFERFTDALFF